MRFFGSRKNKTADRVRKVNFDDPFVSDILDMFDALADIIPSAPRLTLEVIPTEENKKYHLLVDIYEEACNLMALLEDNPEDASIPPQMLAELFKAVSAYEIATLLKYE